MIKKYKSCNNDSLFIKNFLQFSGVATKMTSSHPIWIFETSVAWCEFVKKKQKKNFPFKLILLLFWLKLLRKRREKVKCRSTTAFRN